MIASRLLCLAADIALDSLSLSSAQGKLGTVALRSPPVCKCSVQLWPRLPHQSQLRVVSFCHCPVVDDCHLFSLNIRNADQVSPPWTVDGSSAGLPLGGLGVGVLDRPTTGGQADEGVGSRGRSAGQPSGRASNVVPAPPRNKTLTPLPLPPAESDLEEDLEEEKTRTFSMLNCAVHW